MRYAGEVGTGPATPSSPLLVAAGLVWWRGQLLVQRRSPKAQHGAGLLEFPGGKLETGEAPREALERELVEEWGPHAACLRAGAAAEVLHHVYPPPGPTVLLMVFHVQPGAGAWTEDPRLALRLEPGASVELHRPLALPADDFLAADRTFVGAIRQGRIREPAGD